MKIEFYMKMTRHTVFLSENDLFHSLESVIFHYFALYRSENVKSCILIDYYILRERDYAGRN